MNNIFLHDATPTWSGYIYQGYMAAYLAIVSINDLMNRKISKNEIKSRYYIEMEYTEDIAIAKDNNFISIHQIKNMKSNYISAYRDAIMQLMLEKGFYKQGNISPRAYLHVSEKIDEPLCNIVDAMKQEALSYYKNIQVLQNDFNYKAWNKEKISSISELIKNEPLRLNRKAYRELCNDIIRKCDDANNIGIWKGIKKLLDFCEDELKLEQIEGDIDLFPYGSNNYIEAPDLYKAIVEQIKIYKCLSDNDRAEFLTNNIIVEVLKIVTKRHKLNSKDRKISFDTFVSILDGTYENFELNQNIYALRKTLLQETQTFIDLAKRRNELVSEKELINKVEQLLEIGDEEFVKMCYRLSPNCYYSIEDRSCLRLLLDSNGLNESFLPVVGNENVSFVRENIVNHHKKNSFLTTISAGDVDRVILDIEEASKVNGDCINVIFEADELINSRITAPGKIWNNKIGQIECDDNKKHICFPNFPDFVTANTILEDFGTK